MTPGGPSVAALLHSVRQWGSGPAGLAWRGMSQRITRSTNGVAAIRSVPPSMARFSLRSIQKVCRTRTAAIPAENPTAVANATVWPPLSSAC